MPYYQVFECDHPDYPPGLACLPASLQRLHCHGPLYQQGPAVAIVGARAATAGGMQAAHDLAQGLAARGCRIISGGALGIDASAHRGALAGGGYTLAVMGCGLDCYYPQRNRPLFTRMLERGGALVSPFELDFPPRRELFVQRNKMIAALADAVVVVEASTASGSLHTARSAARYGRHLAACAGSPGCEALLARGSSEVRSAQDVMDVLAGVARPAQVELPLLGSAEERVLASLSHKLPRGPQELAEVSGLPVRQTQRLLLALELRSLVLALPGQRYLRSPLASRQGPGDSGP